MIESQPSPERGCHFAGPKATNTSRTKAATLQTFNMSLTVILSGPLLERILFTRRNTARMPKEVNPFLCAETVSNATDLTQGLALRVNLDSRPECLLAVSPVATSVDTRCGHPIPAQGLPRRR